MPAHRPGDYILNKYLPDATPEAREEARENLYALAAVVVRICTRIASERQYEIRTNGDPEVDSEHSLTPSI